MATKVFLAGATGAIGRKLTPLLVDAGYAVYGTTRSSAKVTGLERAGARAIVVDVFDADALRKHMAAVRPEIVVHQLTDLPQTRDPASMQGSAERNARIRTTGTTNLVAAALACDARRIVAQSIIFAYANGNEPHAETDLLDAETRGSVIALERLTLESPPLTGTVLRYGYLYGPGTWYGEPTGEAAVHVDAAAHAAFLAIERACPGVFNVAEESNYATSAKARATLGWDPEFRLAKGSA